MAFQEKLLAQKRQNGTSAVSVYSPDENVTAIIASVVVCNQTSNAETFGIFLDDDGTTFDESTALYFDAAIAAKTTVQLDTFWPMNNSAGNLGYKTSTANAITISVFGAEVTPE